jgi:hypothetical protein
MVYRLMEDTARQLEIVLHKDVVEEHMTQGWLPPGRPCYTKADFVIFGELEQRE